MARSLLLLLLLLLLHPLCTLSCTPEWSDDPDPRYAVAGAVRFQ